MEVNDVTYYKFRILVLLLLLPVSSYYLLKFFGRLSGVNMFSAVAMAFRFDSSVPVLHRVAAFLGFFMYLCLLVLFLSYLEFPKKLYEMDRYHAGGLMGYSTPGLHTMLYAPSEGRYVDYYFWGGPSEAREFTGTFETVVIFKPPSQEYYEDASQFGIAGSSGPLFLLLAGLPTVYICLFLLAQSFRDYNGLRVKLEHPVIAERFRELAGMPFWKAGIILLSVFLAITLVGIIWSRVLNHRYQELFSVEQQKLRSALLQKVSPGDTVRGRVILRFKSQEQEFHSEETGRRVRNTTSYYTLYKYTIEFNDLIGIPVYLEMAAYPGGDVAKVLEKAFTKEHGVEPDYVKEYRFTVNQDYSVSLKTGDY